MKARLFQAVLLPLLAVVALTGGIYASRFAARLQKSRVSTAVGQARETLTQHLPRPLPEFSLVDTSGSNVSRADFTGKFLVVSFVFTSCSTSCLAVNDRMAEIQRLFHGVPDVQLVSITVDPRSDTPEVLGEFAARFGADPHRWSFLTGPKSAVYHLLENGFISRSPELASLFPGGFSGTDRIMLVDPTGMIREAFDGLRTNVASVVAQRIQHLRAQPHSTLADPTTPRGAL